MWADLIFISFRPIAARARACSGPVGDWAYTCSDGPCRFLPHDAMQSAVMRLHIDDRLSVRLLSVCLSVCL